MICASRRLGEGVKAHLIEQAARLDNQDYDGDKLHCPIRWKHLIETPLIDGKAFIT